MGIIKNIVGQRFGNVVALKISGTNHRGLVLWNCLCDCGRTFIVNGNALRTGNTKTCGCRNGHGMRHARLYRTWINMKQRCENPNQKTYKFYGSKGISVCPEWHNFKKFHEWAVLKGYNDNLTIDRVDVHGNYSPENCRWISMSENVKRKVITQETREKIRQSRIGKTPWNKGKTIKAGMK